MGGLESTPGLDGSGQRAMRENKKALAKIEEEMIILQQRAGNGEIVDKEVKRLVALREQFKQDAGRIALGGM